MAITSSFVGKFGGSTVITVPVSAVGVSGSSTDHRLYTGSVPAGETWWVTVYGEGYNVGSRAEAALYIGSDSQGWVEGGYIDRNYWYGGSSTVQGSFVVDLTTYSTGSNRVSFAGTVTLMKL